MLLGIAHIDFICWVVRSLMLSGRCKASVIGEIPIWVYMYKMDSLQVLYRNNKSLNMRIKGGAEVLTCINNRKQKPGKKNKYSQNELGNKKIFNTRKSEYLTKITIGQALD